MSATTLPEASLYLGASQRTSMELFQGHRPVFADGYTFSRRSWISSTSLLRSSETVALDLAVAEFSGDPSSAKKMRNLSRGLTRFRTEHESKGVHGRSFRGEFSSFAASSRADAPGFLSLPYLCLETLNATTPRPSTLHSPKTLLQHHFRFDEYAFDEDESLLSIEPGKHILGTPVRPLTVLVDELWGLCLDERTIVTSSRASAHDLWPSMNLSRSPALKQPSIKPTDHLPPSLINALKYYFGNTMIIHPALDKNRKDTTKSLIDCFAYELNESNQILPLKTSNSSGTSWRLGRKHQKSTCLNAVQIQDLNLLLSHAASPNCPSDRDEIVRRLQHLETLQLPRILDHMDDWTSTEQKVLIKGKLISYDLTRCLESLWADAIHLFLNLQSVDRLLPMSYWMKIRTRCVKYSTQMLDQESGAKDLFVLPQREGETFQDLERDFQTHLTRFRIERQYLWSHRGVGENSDFLKDIESASGNTSRHCLLHALERMAPFRSNAEADTTVQSYSRRMSTMGWSARHYPSKALLHHISRACEGLEVMQGVIKTQQKAHSKIVCAIRRSVFNNGPFRSWSSVPPKRPKDSAWMKNVKVLEDVEQLQGEGKRLAQQTLQLVEIKVEDQSKAVMVFTIVTVIFLPLSFVSSYFSMNTVGQGQWIFWAVGLSVTFSTVVVALLVAFRGQRWKRRWNEKHLWDKKRG